MTKFIDRNRMMLQRIGRVGGWAPGPYLGKCQNCGEEFNGDKRAFECLPCAIGDLQRQIIDLHRRRHGDEFAHP